MSGPELAKRIVSIRPEIQLPFMSGYTDTPFPGHTLGDYRIDLLQKPFSTHTLVEGVRNVLDLRIGNGTHDPG
jgi:two-component system, cell cycle sensor histidine kinase and response regulator CckA